MEHDYKLIFPKPVLRIKDVTGKLPGFCLHPIPMAQKAMQYDCEGATLLRQIINYDTFRLDIFQLDSEEPFSVSYSLDQRWIFFNFVLLGSIAFTTDQDEYITTPSACSFYLSAEDKGSYRAHCPAGMSELVIISLKPSWVKTVVDKYPMLSEAVCLLLESKNRFDVLPHCRVDDLVRQWLFGVHAFDHDNAVAQHGELQKYIAMALAHYEQFLSSSDYTQSYRIKQYIDKNYADVNLSIDFPIAELILSSTTIIRRFKQEYGLTIRNYCIQVRMQHAHWLLTEEQYSMTEAYHAVGYRNENSFRKAYKKYLAQRNS